MLKGAGFGWPYMGERRDFGTIVQLLAVFVAALLVISAFDAVRADVARGSIRIETVVLLVLLTMFAVAYYLHRQQNTTS